MCSDLFHGYVSIVCDDIHWDSVNWYIYDVSLAFVPSIIICFLHDVIYEYIDAEDKSIEGQLERIYLFLIDGNVIYVCVVCDKVWGDFPWRKSESKNSKGRVVRWSSSKLRDETICCG